MGITKDPEQLKQVLLERDKLIKGGVDVILTGKPGCGKTTGLVQLALENQKRYKDVILWRSSADCQWTLFPDTKKNVVFWLKKGVKFQLIDRNTEKKVRLEDYVYEVREWETAADLVQNLDREKINVVQTIPYSPLNPAQHLAFCWEWVSIFYELNIRIWKQTVSVFYDEFEDMVPEGVGKEFWNAELSFSGIIRALRKNGVSSFLAAHSLQEVHWRIKKKIRYRLYMKGAEPDSKTKIKQNLSRLGRGQGILEGDAFERFKFRYIGEDKNIRAIIRCPKFENA